jgi:hypothetical protein
MTGSAKGARSRLYWFAVLALSLAFLLVAHLIQRGFWSLQNPGQIGSPGDDPLRDLLWPFVIETGLCVAVVAIGAAVFRFMDADQTLQSLSLAIERRRIWLTAAVVVVAALLPLGAAWFVFDRFPNSGDEFSYLFEARTLAGFRLWEAPPALGVDLIPYRTWIFGSKWVSQYPPGWPIALAAGSLAGLPAWAVNAVLGAASVGALASLCRRIASPSASIVAAALYALTPFYLANAASYFSHIFSSLLILLLCHCLLASETPAQARKDFAAGAVLGALAMTRYFDLAALLPALLFWLFAMTPAARPKAIGRTAAGFAPFIALMAAYQYLITGSPFHSTYAVIDQPDASVSIEPALVLIGTLLIPVRLAELAMWSSPLLLVAYLVCLTLKLKDRALAFYDLIFPGFVVAYIFFADLGGNRYGPRYYMDAFPLMMATIVSAQPSVSARLKAERSRVLATVGSIAWLIYLAASWPLAATGLRGEVVSREEPFRLAAEAGISNAVVIIGTTSAPGLVPSDLVRNPPTMDATVLYARAGADVHALREAFPARSLWRYARPDPSWPGDLVRVVP